MRIWADLLQDHNFSAATVWDEFRPQLSNRNKQLLFQRATVGYSPSGSLSVRRWRPAPWEATPDWTECEVTHPESLMEYGPTEGQETHWTLNFANAYLFCAYGTRAFAQDEVQVAEHPILGSLRESMVAGACGISPLTVDNDVPTPITIAGVERVCAIDTQPEAAFPYGIYGRRFASASAQAVEQAVTLLRPPTRSNILAMEAPMGQGAYTPSQIERILKTATTGFGGAKAMSAPGSRVIVHTGHWGTGVYGGNRELMAMLQILAAALVGLDKLVLHAVDAEGRANVVAGMHAFRRLVPKQPWAAIVQAIVAMRFCWGSSDGNRSGRKSRFAAENQNVED